MKKNEAPLTLEAIRDAVVAVYLRTQRDVGVNEIATLLGVPATRVQREVAATGGARGLRASKIPGCKTEEGGSIGGRGNGSRPTTWRPTEAHLVALLRGEDGRTLHRYHVRIRVIAMRTVGSVEIGVHVVSTTAAAALIEARKRAEAKYGPLHANTSMTLEWLGRADASAVDMIFTVTA